MAMAQRTMFIRTESTPNPRSVKFFPGRDVIERGTLEFVDVRDQATQRSPLAKRLLQLEGVEGVMFARDFVSVNIGEDATWQVVKPNVFAVLMDHFDSGAPVMLDSLPELDTTIRPEDSEVVATIKELIETRIRPVIQEDGGEIIYRGFNPDTGIVKIELAGSCRGCASSTVTLQGGVENMLMHYVPEVNGVEQVMSDLGTVNEKAVSELEARIERVNSGGGGGTSRSKGDA